MIWTVFSLFYLFLLFTLVFLLENQSKQGESKMGCVMVVKVEKITTKLRMVEDGRLNSGHLMQLNCDFN